MSPVTRNPDASVKILNWEDMPPPSGGATEATQLAILAALFNKLAEGGTVALDAATLAALENVVVSGTVSVVEPVSVDDNGGSLTVDGTVAISGTVPVSGTITANLGTIDGAATEATLLALQTDVANGVTINQPVAVTDNGGSLTVDGTVAVTGSVSVTGPLTDAQLRATPVPISGTVTANLGTIAGAATEATLASLAADVANGVTINQPVAVTDNSGSLTVDGTVDLGATTLAALESVTVQNPAGASAVNIQDGGNSITVDGTISVSGTVPVSGPLTDAQLRATPVPVSGTVTANAGTGPWPVTDNAGSLTVDTPQLPAALVSGRLSVDASAVAIPVTDNGGSLTVDGTVAVSNMIAAVETGLAKDATLTNATQKTKIVDTAGTNVATVSAAGAVKVDGSAVTQPVSGTVTANAGTGPWPVTDNGGSLTVDGTVAVSGSVAVTGPLTDVQLRATPVPVSGTLTANPTTPATVRNGQATVAVTNTAVAISASVAVTGLVVQALAANTSNVVVGSSAVTVANGFQLQPGQATGIAIDDAAKVFVNGTSGDGVCWVGS